MIKKQQKGFTLIELLVSIMILSMMAMCFVALISNSYKDVFASGNESKALYQAQETTEIQMSSGTAVADTSLTIQYDAAVGVSPVVVQGKIHEATASYNGKNVKITSFIVKK